MDNRREEFDGGAGEADAEGAADRTSRLERRLSALAGRQHQPEPISVLRLLNTDELSRALALIERAGVMPDGDVRHPEAFLEAPPEEREALEHWRELCGEPLDHLELAEELLDRVGERRGWRSPQALEVALLLKRLEMPDESSWFVRKTAEAVVALYAEMDEHEGRRSGASLHPHVRASVRRLERLEEIDRFAPESPGAAPEREGRIEVETPQSDETASEGLSPGPVPQALRRPQRATRRDRRSAFPGGVRSSGSSREGRVGEEGEHGGHWRVGD